MADSTKKDVNYNIKIDGKVSPSLKSAGNIIEIIQDKIKSINNNPAIINIVTKGADKAIAAVGKLKAGIGNSFKGIGDNVKGLVNDIPGVGQAIGLLTNPIGAATAAAVAFGTAMVGTAKDIKAVDQQIKGFTKSSEDMKKTNDIIRGINKTFDDIDTSALAEASKVLVNQFGIDGAKAAKLVSDGLIATNGKLNLDDVKEFATQIKQSGGSAEDLVKTLATSEQAGLFSNKGIDAMKEFNLRIKDLPDAAKEALTKTGVNVAKLEKDIQTGALSSKDAFNNIFKNVDSLDPKTQQQLISNLLGGAGEDVGVKGIKALANQTQSLDEMKKKYADVAKKNDINLEITEAQSKATRGIIPILTKVTDITKRLELAFWKVAEPIMEVVNKILPELISSFKTVWDVITSVGEAISEIWHAVFGEGVFDSMKKVFGWLTSTLGFIWDLTKQIFGVIAEVLGFLLFNDALDKLGDRLRDISKKPVVIEVEENQVGNANSNGTNNSNGATPPTVASLAGKAMDNTVKSSVQGEVKQITVTIGAIQDVANQYISSQGDMDSFKEQLQEALVSIVEDFSQY